MLRRFTRVFGAFIIALAATMQGGVRAMPMAQGMTGMAIQQSCPSCPHDPNTGTSPDKMPTCQVLACAGAVAAILPASALLPERVIVGAAYLMTSPARQTGASPTPDPFPPRSIALA
jgi:hypothetical protein